MKTLPKKQKMIVKKFKALSHPARIKLVQELIEKDCCVGELQKCLKLSQPNVSQHLRVLKDAGILEGKRYKNQICYRIKDENIVKILQILNGGEEK
jgi:DNA-binding transcriptional ArsR family regulator